MTLDDLNRILGSSRLQEVLVRAAAYENDPLGLQDFLRGQSIPSSLARAMADLVILRRRARTKFTRADRMFLTGQGLEQSTSEAVARHRARRFAGHRLVADLCCGVGGDLIALACGSHIIAVDRDMLHLCMARENAGVYEVGENVDCVCADARDLPVEAEAFFLDPSRRVGGRRVQDLEAMSPPVSFVADLMRHCPNVAVKLSPAADYESLPWDGEIEIVSERGEAKEGVLWLGNFKTCRRRATLLPSGETLTDEPVNPPPVTEPKAYLYEPDAAVIRAHLVDTLASRLNASRIDSQIAYLTADEYRKTPFADVYRVEEVWRLDIKTIRRRLREKEVGRIVIKNRGVKISPEELRKALALKGHGEALLFLTRLMGRPHVLLCAWSEQAGR